MADDVDELESDDPEIISLAQLTEEVTRRLESGESVNAAECLTTTAADTGPIRELLPTLQAMVSLGEQIAREAGSRTRFQKNKERKSS